MKYNNKTVLGIYKRVVGAMAGLSTIQVKIHPQIVPQYNPSQNLILMPESVSYAENDDENFRFGRGIMVHESSHVLFAPCWESMPKVPILHDFHEWLNVFLDVNNEFKVSKVFPSLKAPLAEKTNALLKKRPETLTSDNPFVQVIMRCDMLASIKPEFPKNYSHDLKEFVERTVKKYMKKKIYSCKGSILVKFTKEVTVDWNKLCKERAKQVTKWSALMKDLDMRLGDAIKEGNEEEISRLEAEKGKQSLPAWFKNTNCFKRDHEFGEKTFSEDNLEHLKEIVRKASEKEQKQKREENYGFSRSPGLMRQIRPEGDPIEDYDKDTAMKQGRVINRAFKNKIRLQEDFEKKHRSGSLDTNEVVRQVMQSGRVIKPNVFERHNNLTRGGEWAIEIMVDCSGSMDQNTKMGDAKQALATLAFALNNLSSVNYALTGFNECAGYREFQIKKFSERALITRYLDCLHPGGGTPIEKAVQMGAKRLNKFKNMKKILVIISDGEGNEKLTTKNVRIAERMRIKVLGIGIGNSRIKNSFPDHYIYEDTKNLDKDLIRIILQRLKNQSTKLVKKVWER